LTLLLNFAATKLNVCTIRLVAKITFQKNTTHLQNFLQVCREKHNFLDVNQGVNLPIVKSIRIRTVIEIISAVWLHLVRVVSRVIIN